jgi:starch synthase
MAGAGRSTLKVALLRADDLEARELAAFAQLNQTGLIDATAIGDRPGTPYGVESLDMTVEIRPSIRARLGRLPFGRTIAGAVERRHLPGVGYSPGLARRLNDFDVVNVRETFHSQSARAVKLLAGSENQRLVVSCFENIAFRYEEDPLFSRNKDLVRASADYFVANSPGAAAALTLEGVPKDRVRIVPPAVDTDRFSPGEPNADLRHAWRATGDEIVILYAGRLLREKGLTEFIISVRDILASPEARARLVLHGSGPELPRLQRVVSALDLRERVSFSRWFPAAKMPDVYRSADIVVLPSLVTPYWSEQFGYSLAESMSCARPVVAADTGEISWVLGGGGIAVDPRQSARLQEVLTLLCTDQASRQSLGQRARDEAVERYSVGAAGRELVRCFEIATELPRRAQVR